MQDLRAAAFGVALEANQAECWQLLLLPPGGQRFIDQLGVIQSGWVIINVQSHALLSRVPKAIHILLPTTVLRAVLPCAPPLQARLCHRLGPRRRPRTTPRPPGDRPRGVRVTVPVHHEETHVGHVDDREVARLRRVQVPAGLFLMSYVSASCSPSSVQACPRSSSARLAASRFRVQRSRRRTPPRAPAGAAAADPSN